jgi:Putative peptidoglycan binding domain
MSKFQIRSPLLITTALALAPALAFAAEPSQKHTTTSTTTTTSPQGNAPASAPNTQATIDQQGSAVLSPSTPPDMTETDAMRMNRAGNPDAIDPAQVQKVFGMDVALIDLKTLNKDQVRQLQQRLHERGFYRGKVDGAMGPQTRNALTGLMAQQYALNQRLVNQGQITEQLATSIGLDTRGRAPMTGVDLNDQAGQHPAPPANAQSTTPIPPNQ